MVMLNIGEFARIGQVSPRMLRHYDEIGLLKPNFVDPRTAYRSYEVGQLGRLHRLIALRDLGFTLDQILQVLDAEPSVEQSGECSSFARPRSNGTSTQSKSAYAVWMHISEHLKGASQCPASTSQSSRPILSEFRDLSVASGFGHENLGPIFGRLVPKLLVHLGSSNARPGIMISWYEDPSDDGSVVLHAGFDIGDQIVVEVDGFEVVDLPSITVASYFHRGPLNHIADVYEALVSWIEDSGYRLTGGAASCTTNGMTRTQSTVSPNSRCQSHLDAAGSRSDLRPCQSHHRGSVSHPTTGMLSLATR